VCTYYNTLWLSNSDDAVRATSDWYGQQRYDDILLQDTANTARLPLPWARVRALLRCELPDGQTIDCVLVEAFELAHGERRALQTSTGTPLVRLSGRLAALFTIDVRQLVHAVPHLCEGTLAGEFRINWWVCHGSAAYPHAHRNAFLHGRWAAQRETIAYGPAEM
jgi:hypothetical protein